jgi:mono/diheme cytochrome c family protein
VQVHVRLRRWGTVRKYWKPAMATISALLGLGLIVSACSSGNSSGSIAGDASSGQQLYQTDCASCHGVGGAGGTKIGDDTAPDIRFATLNDMYNGDWSLAKRAILDGKDEEGNALDPAMPRWSGKLSDAQVNDIIAFLQTLK